MCRTRWSIPIDASIQDWLVLDQLVNVSSSSCMGASGLCTSWVKHNDFRCFKGVTSGALTLCYKLRSFMLNFAVC